MTDAGLALLEHFEGFRDEPYYDMVGVRTIGYGTTFPISTHEGELLLKSRLEAFEDEVDSLLTVALTLNQRDALLCLVYNIGITAFKTSHLRYLINSGAPNAAILVEWMKWDHAGGRVLAGLEARRKSEVKLWETP